MNSKHLFLIAFCYVSISTGIAFSGNIKQTIETEYIAVSTKFFTIQYDLWLKFNKFCRTRKGREFRPLNYLFNHGFNDYSKAKAAHLIKLFRNPTFYKTISEQQINHYYFFGLKKLIFGNILHSLHHHSERDPIELLDFVLNNEWEWIIGIDVVREHQDLHFLTRLIKSELHVLLEQEAQQNC